jgi:hypothetical protein
LIVYRQLTTAERVGVKGYDGFLLALVEPA